MNIIKIGKALRAEKLVKIIEYLLVNPEISIAEAAELLESTRMPAWRYLIELFELGVLEPRYDGRNVYYSLNRAWFREASEELLRLSVDEPRESDYNN